MEIRIVLLFVGLLKGCIFLQLVILLVFVQLFCGLSKRMYYTTLVIPLVFVYFPKHFLYKETISLSVCFDFDFYL